MAKSREITSGIVANEIGAVWLINNGNDCIGAIHEETGAFGDGTGDSKLAALDRIGTFG
jgi:hypothetical protein